MAAIALLRLHHYTDDASYRAKAEQTLETFAGVAAQYGIFVATYGIAVAHFLASPTQIVIIGQQNDSLADELQSSAVTAFAFHKTVLRFTPDQITAENLPLVLSSTLPNLSQLQAGKSFAVLCSGTSCRPPVFTADQLRTELQQALQS
jgi:uncharacterized protein YyaL (SSP411 family)